jgi:hypothetical protein
MQYHDFTQRFLANERQLELDAEAERARLALLIGRRGRPRNRLPLAKLKSVARRGANAALTRVHRSPERAAATEP